MKQIITVIIIFYCSALHAQSETQTKIADGSKILTELIKVIKGAKNEKECIAKKLSDLCFKNGTGRKVKLSIYLKTDAGYVKEPLRLIILASTEECFFELTSGVYKYQIELISANAESEIIKMGEVKLKPCERTVRDIIMDENE